MKRTVCLGLLFICMAAPCFAGDLWIYDAANQPIGILLGMNDSYMDVYIPSLT